MAYAVPASIVVKGKEYPITNEGDYRMVLDCFSALDDIELEKEYRLISALIIFYEDFNSIGDVTNRPMDEIEALVNEMFTFFNCGQEGSSGVNVDYKLIDWQKDSQIISSAINKVAGKETRAEEYIHWWTYMGYYMAVGESPLATIVSIRHKIVKNKKLEKYEMEFRRDNPQYFNWNRQTVEQQEADKLVRQLWNSGN